MPTHVLLEIYCTLCLSDDSVEKELTCRTNKHTPSFECLSTQCPYVTFTSCENSFCYIGKQSQVEAMISFGGEMQKGNDARNLHSSIELWKEIATKKIDEAYDEYMEVNRTGDGLREPG